MFGGEFGPNIFRQDRRLNQGLSEQGKRYRALERAAAGAPAALFFGNLLYADPTAYPRYIEIAILLPGKRCRGSSSTTVLASSQRARRFEAVLRPFVMPSIK
jgi:hypothetical protein